MKCYKHPEIDSVAYCGQCGRAVCAQCRHDVRGMIYCEECLAARMQSPVYAPLVGSGTGPNPGTAALLSVIPGVGAAYNGQIVKGLMQLIVFVTLWELAQHVDVFGWAVAAWWFYICLDSYQTAKRKQLGLPTEEWFGLGESNVKLNASIGAVLLIGLGVLFLLQNLGVDVFGHISKFWPVLLIVLGVIALQKRMGSGAPPSSGGGTGQGRSGPTGI